MVNSIIDGFIPLKILHFITFKAASMSLMTKDQLFCIGFQLVTALLHLTVYLLDSGCILKTISKAIPSFI